MNLKASVTDNSLFELLKIVKSDLYLYKKWIIKKGKPFTFI